MCRKELCRFLWALWPQLSGTDVCPDLGLLGVLQFWDLVSSQAPCTTRFGDGGGCVGGMFGSLELMGRMALAQEGGTLGPAFTSTR